MKRLITIPLLLLFFSSIIYSCREDYDASDAMQDLTFSQKEIEMSTVFTNITSSTYVLKVYNKQCNDVNIPSVSLQNGTNSYYTIEVNGQQNSTQKIENVLIRKNDSIQIYVTINAKSATSSPYTDAIVFNLGGKTQTVNLKAPVENAAIIQDASGTNTLNSNTTWDASQAKIIKNDVVVKSGNTLTINAGTHLYFAKNAHLIIENGATLTTNGSLSEKVTFRGERTELQYDSLFGTWGGIELKANATASMKNTIVKGAKTAISLTQSKLTLENTEIYNSNAYGILANNSTINAINTVVNQASAASVFLHNGGNYNFTHCTLVNYWQYVGEHEFAVYLSNTDGKGSFNNLTANFANSILYSKDKDGLYMAVDTSKSAVTLNFESNLINATNSDAADFTQSIFKNTIANQNPLLANPFLFSTNNLQLTATSPALNKGNSIYTGKAPLDITGKTRASSSDLGAYEF